MWDRTACGSRATSNPAMLARPEVGGSMVVNIFISVLLPAPFGPIRAKVSPAKICRKT